MVSVNPQATFLLVGCKRDLATEGHREVSVEEAQVSVQYVVIGRVPDPSHFHADPDPALHVGADPDPVFTSVRIRIFTSVRVRTGQLNYKLNFYLIEKYL
jgi:hypothetical protein